MANTGLTAPSKLSIPQLTEIHITHPSVGKAIQAILDYVNLNLPPVQGNKKAPRKVTI